MIALRQRLLFVLFCLGLVLVFFWSKADPSRQLRGIAVAQTFKPTSVVGGQVASLPVALHQSIDSGATVAVFDTRQLLDQRRILAAELEALNHRLPGDSLAQIRRLADDLETAELETAESAARVARDEAELDVLRQELSRDQALLESGVLAEDRVREKEREIAVAEARLSANRATLEQALAITQQAEGRRQLSPGPNPWPAVVAQRKLDSLSRRIEEATLRSPIDGQVTSLFLTTGEVARPGEAILEITPATTHEVHLYLPSPDDDSWQAGSAVAVTDAQGNQHRGQIATLGVDRRQIERQLWRRDNQAEYGYLIRIELSDATLRPGELVLVRLAD